MFTPRRLDGETVSSPHVPSSSLVQRFTFVGESQTSQISGNISINELDLLWIDLFILLESNDREQPGSDEHTVISESTTDFTYWNTQITQLFLTGEMPKEFYDLWLFCKRLNPTHPEGLIFSEIYFNFNFIWLNYLKKICIVLDALLSVGLKLVGPYDVLAGHMNQFDANDTKKTVLHWRYYYDPPEFQVCIFCIIHFLTK